MTKTVSQNCIDQCEWTLCPECRGLIYGKRLIRTLRVCPDCGAHHRMTAHERITHLLDAGSIELLEPAMSDTDPLDFVDTKSYPQRLRAVRATTGLSEAVVLAGGAVEGNPVIVAAMDFRFLGGSLGSAAGDLITAAAEVALTERTPLLLVTASGGARMQEGVLSLMQMAKTSQALGQLDEAGVLTISLITDPTYGGVAASFATLCDVILAEPKARMGFAGPRVIQQTIGQTLPDGFQTAEFLLERGLIDGIRTRGALRPTLGRLLSIGGRLRVTGPATATPASNAREVVRDPGRLPERDAWQVVKLARNLRRPTTMEYVVRAFEDFEELRGDRLGGECSAIVGGMARLDGIGVVVVGSQKGHIGAELARNNYGMPTPSGYRKAARLMRLAEKLGLPVITIIDTPGAYPGVSAEEQGQSIAVAENIRLMAGLSVPIVAVITGEGGSGGALALAIADRVLACSNAIYSVISPEGCAAILWNDSTKAPEAAAALRVDARELLRFGIVDGVVMEPQGGTQADHVVAAQRFKNAVLDSLAELTAMDEVSLRAARMAKYRAFGAVIEPSAHPARQRQQRR